MSASIDQARQALQSQPFSQLLGTELTRYGEEGVELRIPITDGIKQQNGFVHGGVVSYAADNALTFAGATALGPMVLTAEYKINYVRPAVGEALLARASVIHGGRTQAVCRCEVFMVRGDEAVLCAVAQGTISRVGTRA